MEMPDIETVGNAGARARVDSDCAANAYTAVEARQSLTAFRYYLSCCTGENTMSAPSGFASCALCGGSRSKKERYQYSEAPRAGKELLPEHVHEYMKESTIITGIPIITAIPIIAVSAATAAVT